jgi:hypothetical protein
MAGVRHQSNELELFIESVVTECGANRAIELRLISSGPDGAHAELRKDLLSTLEVKGINTDGAFPIVDHPMHTDSPSSSSPSYGPDPGMEKLLSISTEHLPASLGRQYIASVNSDEGGLFINSWSGTQRFDLQDSTIEDVFESSDGGHEISATRLGDQVYVAMDGELYTCSDGVLTPMDMKAHSVASVGDGDLLIHREIELSETLGFGDNNPSISQLVLRGSSGEERVVHTFRHQAILGMDACGRHVLLQLGDGSEGDPEIDVVITELGTDTRLTETERWLYVTHVRPAPNGWLIAGVPSSGAPGTYLMQLDGTRRRILEDHRVRAIGLSEDQRLYYVVFEGALVDGAPKLRSVALSDLQEGAILRAPWSAIDLSKLSRDAQPSEGLANRDEGAIEAWMTFLEKVTVDELKALTNASPQGFRLRDFLYRRLIQFDRATAAAELAGHHADSEHASYTDVAVAFGSQELTEESAGETIDRLKGAIRRFPRVADFYVLPVGPVSIHEGAREVGGSRRRPSNAATAQFGRAGRFIS